MSKPLFNVKVAMLVASGFNQHDMTQAQRALLDAGANVRIISPDNGLVNGWEGTSWGHNFAVDSHISKALGADFGILVIPGGQRSVDKLKLTAHTKRFVSSFFAANKPVVVMNEGVAALCAAEVIQGRTVNGPEVLADFCMQHGAIWSDDFACEDRNLISGECTNEDRGEFIAEMVTFLTASAVKAEPKAA